MADLELEASPAWLALGRSAKRTYVAIAERIAASGSDRAAVTYDDLQYDYRIGAPAPAIRTLRYLKMVTTEPGQSLATVFRLCSGYKDLDQAQVEKLMALAREVRGHEPAARSSPRQPAQTDKREAPPRAESTRQPPVAAHR